MNEKILAIEDDEIISRFLKIAITSKGYTFFRAKDGISGIDTARTEKPDVILLDLGLPDIDGIEVLHQLLTFSSSPIIVISARTKEHEKVEALDQGADDYLTKPFNVGELLARIRVVLRRQKSIDTKDSFEFGELKVDYEKRRVTRRTEDIHFTPIEYRLLLLLIEYQGKVLTHSFIQQKIWGYESSDEYQSLRVFMASIRRKIEDDSVNPKYILTEIGVGYRFLDEWCET
ncbi:MAG: response regulator [Candidatus Izemoplasmatales bacterium]|jgi:two-component system KDP operon response regulator KdpE|nr:response regulator [Candidatus Izemoplasmatales bacterium]